MIVFLVCPIIAHISEQCNTQCASS